MDTKQRMGLSPGLRQSVEVLQMDSQELDQYVERMAEENPLIEVQYSLDSSRIKNGKSSQHLLQIAASPRHTLQEHLQSQLNLLELPKKERDIAAYLIGCLQDIGYLEERVEEIAAGLGVSCKDIEVGLRHVQSLEPYGVGARNLQECLVLQLEHTGRLTPLLQRLIERHLEQLGSNQLVRVAKELKTSLKSIQESFHVIKSLNPRPGNTFDHGECTVYIVPDVYIMRKNGRNEAAVHPLSSPQVALVESYQHLLSLSGDEETRSYLREKNEQAIWIMKCLEDRKATLCSVAGAILKVQRSFFERGKDYLVPLTLSKIAEELNLHESTVSRAIRGKFLRCIWGTFELKYFFPSEIAGEASGWTPDALKRIIRDLIEEEDKQAAYSDRRIAELLLEQGVVISRRTVAKYRESMRIAAAPGRREYLM
ncbi:RNA polymerase factor sigma-54 [Paenibacillus sp. HN-1]|uniref:RNA polymerase factor sigma-54 n=1 Tax=Paenibacillus TaxID=44249 RepID=UPI001CA7D20A|nr:MULTISPECIES: RNA polymerase factor sigma-54 [Paenibacillus]MBY9081360.1 RNA polymerase factor sigma-54 [Paenibacillus sp. CGMCC 1.18879]MBY9085040.1 RNA polymerase factor sigma-54 [Paenibacillus sinensis]